MSEPKTLLALAGADLTPSPLSKAALVMIDLQNEYRTGALPLAGVDAATAMAAKLLARARAAGAPVVHIAHAGRAGGPVDRAAERGQIMAAVAPAGDEPVIEKPLPNAFAKTGLHETLQRLGRPELIVAGFMTHMCVSSTVRAALDLGYRVTVVGSACATRDLPAPDGGAALPAALRHRSELAALADRFAIIAPDAEALPA
jgi:nicotinamidase-related amidase